MLLIFCWAAICYYIFAIYAAIRFFQEPRKFDPSFHPPITILKPLCGIDSLTYQNIASFCQQDYPIYQVVFAIRDRQDPGIKVVEKIISDFPNIDIDFVINDRVIGTNLKVSNLANGLEKAKYSILLISDSDVKVGTDYLSRVVQPLADPQVGVVTCMYNSLTQGWVATFEALGISCDFQPSVLVARYLEGITFAFGAGIAIKRSVLEEIGGFAAIADYLQDDYKLGYLPAQAGYQVVLSDYLVEHFLDTPNLLDLIAHQIRWYRCMRYARPWGYVGLIFTNGVSTSLLFLLVSNGSWLGWTVFGITWSLRLLMVWIVAVNQFRDPIAKKFIWLVPLRDLVSFFIWVYGFIGNTVQWRGQKLKLLKGGKLVPC